MRRVRFSALVLVAVIATVVPISPASAAEPVDWAQVGFGPDKRHQNPYETTLKRDNVNMLVPKFTLTPPDYVRGGVIVAGGRLFFSAGGTLYAHDAVTGAFLWSAPGNTAPGVSGTDLFVQTSSALDKLDVATGALQCSAPAGGFSDVALADGMAFVIKSAVSKVFAVNTSDCSVAWSRKVGNNPYSPSVGGGRVFVGSNDAHVYALDEITGVILWGRALTSIPGGPPTAVGNNVYVSTYGGELTALKAASGRVAWSVPGFFSYAQPAAQGTSTIYVNGYAGGLEARRTSNGSVIWSSGSTGSFAASPTVAHGVVYSSEDSAEVRAVNSDTGATLFTASTGSSCFDCFAFAEPVVVNGMLYVASIEDQSGGAISPTIVAYGLP